MFGWSSVSLGFFILFALFVGEAKTSEVPTNITVLEVDHVNTFSTIRYQATDVDFGKIIRRSEGWIDTPSEVFDVGFSSNVYWLKQELKNPTENKEWFLTLDNTRLDFVDFYLVSSEGLQHLSSGDHRPISEQLSSQPTFRFYLPKLKSAQLYIRVQSETKVDFLPRIRSSFVYGQYTSFVKTIHILYLFILLAFIAFQIILNKQMASKLTLYYAVGLCFGFAYILFYFGEGNLLFWPDNSAIKNRNVFIFAMLACAFFSLFIQKYLRSSVVTPRLRYLVNGYLIFIFISIVITLFPVSNFARVVLVLLAAAGLVFLTFIGSLRSVQRGSYWALWLNTPLVFTMIALFVYIFTFLGLIPYTMVTSKLFLWSIPFDMLLISLSLVFRHYGLRRERDELFVKLEYIAKQQNDIVSDTPSTNQPSEDINRRDLNNRLKNINTHKTIVKLVNYLEQEKAFLDPELSVEKVALSIDVRPDQLSALINTELNTSFPTLINIKRLDAASSLLKNNPQKTILNVALECGFNSKSNFNRLFKVYFETTPTLYRKLLTQHSKD